MEIKRVFDLLDNYVEKYPNQQVALAGKKNGQWVNYSSVSYKEHADALSYALIELGIEKGDKIAMILTNRPEWNMLDMVNKRTRKVYYWEHFGRMDDPKYIEDSFIPKISDYYNFEFLPGEKLLMTFESKHFPLDTTQVKRLIDTFLK